MSTPTRFDPIIQAVTRRAEDIYSKMAIRRDESEDLGRRKKEEGDKADTSLLWEDTTEVTITALRSFLEDLLGTTHSTVSPTAPHPQIQGSAESAEPTTPVHAVNPSTARAINAYHATGIAVHDHNIDIPPPPPTQQSTSDVQLGSDFGTEEQERIRGYIVDMNTLEAKGILALTLKRSLTFLESIHQAIDEAKAYPK